MLELGFYENFKSVIRKLKNTEQLTQQDELAAAAVTGGTYNLCNAHIYVLLVRMLYPVNVSTLIRISTLSNPPTLLSIPILSSPYLGIVSFLTTPLDLIKTKLMMQSTSSGGQYSGVFDALSSIYNEGGNILHTSSTLIQLEVANIHLDSHTWTKNLMHTIQSSLKHPIILQPSPMTCCCQRYQCTVCRFSSKSCLVTTIHHHLPRSLRNMQTKVPSSPPLPSPLIVLRMLCT